MSERSEQAGKVRASRARGLGVSSFVRSDCSDRPISGRNRLEAAWMLGCSDRSDCSDLETRLRAFSGGSIRGEDRGAQHVDPRYSHAWDALVPGEVAVLAGV